jgi:hypothetical protein
LDSPVPELSHPSVRRLFDYWRGKGGADRLPGRQDVDPLDIPDLLPHVTIFDVERGAAGLRFRIRLLGTATVELLGSDCTGHYLDEQMLPEDAARIIASYRLVVEERRPHFWRSYLLTPGREHIHYERLLLPLARDGRTVDMLLALFVPVDPPPSGG